MASRLDGESSVASVASIAELVELILSFLPAKALFSCRQVCRLWRDTTARIMRARQKLGWLSFVTFHEPQRTPCASKLSMDILGRRVMQFLQELPLVPAACILFVSRRPQYFEGRRDEVKSLLTLVKESLPRSCVLIGCVGAGIIGTGDNGVSEEVETAEGIALMLMPQTESVSAHIINLGQTEVKTNRAFKSRWEKSLKIPLDGSMKCVFLLAKDDDVIGKVASGIWNACNRDESKSDVVILGGLSESFLMVNNEVKNSGVVGLSISGNVEALSMVHHGDTSESLQQTLKEMKQSGIPCDKNAKTACFMVSCIGRGEKIYGAKNVETGIFRKEFPDIPVLGFFGNGELGLDLHSCKGRPEKDGHFLHSFSSVFCLCSLSPQCKKSLTDEDAAEALLEMSESIRRKSTSSQST